MEKFTFGDTLHAVHDPPTLSTNATSLPVNVTGQTTTNGSSTQLNVYDDI
jgi:hypothetical protein